MPVPVKSSPSSRNAGKNGIPDTDKLRGGYYTPPAVADLLTRWAIRTPQDSFLEPSCGDGAVLSAGISRLVSLGADRHNISDLVQAAEITADEAVKARNRVSGIIPVRRNDIIVTDDFFHLLTINGNRKFTACIGNPPFIRYQNFPEPARSMAMKLMTEAGLRPNKLTNTWVPFVVGATESLETGGRLAMIIPAELLQVSYAAQLRVYLTERFTRVVIVTCNELFFEGAEQEVVILLAENSVPRDITNSSCRLSVVETGTVRELLTSDVNALIASSEEKTIHDAQGEKWLKLFLTNAEIGFMREVGNHPGITPLKKLASVDVGIVTGNNEFFVLRKSELEITGLRGKTVPLISRTAHLRGAVMSEQEWRTLAEADERVNMLNIRQDMLDENARAYIRQGEKNGVHTGYKCSIRKPWYHVPSLWNPDAFLFRQIHDFPRFVHNTVQATATDTIHRVTVHGCEPSALIAATFTCLTGASAELVGRSYGGGVLELEPSEAERLLIPGQPETAVPLEEADKLVRSGRLGSLLEENGRIILRGQLGMSVSDCDRLNTIWTKMRERRMNRGKKPAKTIPTEGVV